MCRMMAEGEDWKLAAITTPQRTVSASSGNHKSRAISLDGSAHLSSNGVNTSALRYNLLYANGSGLDTCKTNISPKAYPTELPSLLLN